MSDTYILISQIYNTNKIRFNEMLKTLNNNIENKNIEEIILLNEKHINLDINSSKVKEIIINNRLTYKIAFDYAEYNIPANKIVILANSDIWFDNSIINISKYNLDNQIIALSRYDIKENSDYKLFTRPDSQDSWIFKNPIKLQHDYNIELGRGGCDNRIAWIIYNSKKDNIKYNIINPAKTIKSYHEHLYNIRNWTPGEIKGPYMWLYIV